MVVSLLLPCASVPDGAAGAGACTMRGTESAYVFPESAGCKVSRRSRRVSVVAAGTNRRVAAQAVEAVLKQNARFRKLHSLRAALRFSAAGGKLNVLSLSIPAS